MAGAAAGYRLVSIGQLSEIQTKRDRIEGDGNNASGIGAESVLVGKAVSDYRSIRWKLPLWTFHGPFRENVMLGLHGLPGL